MEYHLRNDWFFRGLPKTKLYFRTRKFVTNNFQLKYKRLTMDSVYSKRYGAAILVNLGEVIRFRKSQQLPKILTKTSFKNKYIQ